MPKATANIVSVSPYHNHSAGDLADELGTLKAEIAALEDREKSLRDELIRRGGAEIEGSVYRPRSATRCAGRSTPKPSAAKWAMRGGTRAAGNRW